jgi:DNA-binding IclR family transcriptional regulator
VLLAELGLKERRHLLDNAPASAWENQTPADVEARITECRRLGYCGDYGRYNPTVHALSAPVRDGTGAIVGAFTVVGFALDFEGRRRAGLAKHLLAATSVCTAALRGQPLASAAA